MAGPPLLSRRAVLIGGAGTLLLAACGGKDDDGSASTDTVPSRNLLMFTPPQGALVTGAEQRLCLGLADAEGVPLAEVPDRIDFTIRADGAQATTSHPAQAHAEGLAAAYYPVTFTLDQAGLYEIGATIDGEALTPRPFQLADEIPVPTPGDALAPVATPTTADHRGVDPICTRSPACPFHDVSLTDALAEGGPVAFLIATPEFCQTAICGPVLDVLLDLAPDHPDVTFVHAEVYADPRDVSDITQAQLAPATEAYQLGWEPCLFLADSSGTLVSRLDTIYDRAEADEALRALT